MAGTFDFVIVGGGTAGCLLAKRLASTNKKPSILLIEVGGDGSDINIRSPYGRFLNAFTRPELDHGYSLKPDPNLSGVALPYARGKGLGGSSLINFMCYTRGSAADYDKWAELVGSEDWDWKHTEERFKKIESFSNSLSPEVKQYANVEPGSLGTDGLVEVSLPSIIDPELKLCLEAAAELGIPSNPNINSGNPVGVGLDFLSVKDGLRTTSSSAHLRSATDNLTVWTNTQVTKIVLDGKKAVGVETLDGRKVSSAKEVILCAGAFDSPKLLLLSGIGPADDLASVNIETKHELHGVGKNLQDHNGFGIVDHLERGISHRVCFMGSPDQVKAAEEQWRRDQTGPIATTTHDSALAFIKDPEITNSDEFRSLPSEVQKFLNLPNVPHYEIVMNAAIFPMEYAFDDLDDAFLSFYPIIMNPQSRGSVNLRSANPAEPPVVDMAYYQHPYDRRVMICAVRRVLSIMKSKTISKVWKARIIGPKGTSDEDIWDYIKANGFPIWHANGSAKMGKKEDKMACVDAELRVHGLESLRVADLSVCPTTPNNHTQATAYLIGEFAAEKIIQEYSLD
ncbi:glucose-methanol-choline oxidoreductase [Xylogone sp. PMI_703]|nr:glucose-methanol-choline oxidoreductase [Xylogone sp. PMI_703]